MTRLGVLTGMASEARLLERALARTTPVITACTGADPARAHDAAERLIGAGAEALLSFGLAGGLDPRLSAGDLVLADRVILPEGRAVPTTAAWREATLAQLGGTAKRPLVGPLAGSTRLLALAAEKRRLGAASGAVAADMESHALAAVAEAAGLPFLVIRAVSDSVACDLPSVARIPLHPDGRIRIGAAIRHLSMRPGEWPSALRLGRDTRAGLAGLGRVARAAALALP